ncbi:MAG: hypothetical protein EA356_06410 [Geminicoccaceae bacterium]|nr:MAG: hypothetical protein EA356_06410 [Geminicoccaceae bacterium]
MSTLYPVQTSFSAGEIDPALVGRTDLKAYLDGASRLANVFVTVGGGVRRRAGMRHVAELAAGGRLALAGLDGGKRRLFVMLPGKLSIFDDEVLVADLLAPWSETHLPSLSWAVHRGHLLVCHPSLPPHRASLELLDIWRLLPWSYPIKDLATPGHSVIRQPYAKFAPDDATLEAAPAQDGNWAFTSNRQVFQPGHVGTRLRFRNVEVAITSIGANGTRAFGVPQGTIENASRTTLWEEQAFGPVNGYPAAAVVYRDRLVVGGVPRMPNRLWLSRIGQPFDFDTGEGLDDEAMSFQLGDDRAHAIRGFGAGRSLEVFTAAGEWTVDGNPLSPASVQVVRQTGIGSLADRYVPPAEVDGASVFIARSGDAVVEYVFTDVNVAYQAQDLAVRARHLVQRPVDLAFDAKRRLLLLVGSDGQLVTATIDRHAGIVAWSKQQTAGEVLAVAAAEGTVFLLVRRAGKVRIECLEDPMPLDAAVRKSSATPRSTWTGLDHLTGHHVGVIADGSDLGTFTIGAGALTLPMPAKEIVVGLGFEHRVEPLPLLIDGRRKASRYRPLQVTFELHETAGLTVDVGEGLHPITLPPGPSGRFSGPRTVRARGWRNLGDGPLWRIHETRPLAFELLSVISDVKVTR